MLHKYKRSMFPAHSSARETLWFTMSFYAGGPHAYIRRRKFARYCCKSGIVFTARIELSSYDACSNRSGGRCRRGRLGCNAECFSLSLELSCASAKIRFIKLKIQSDFAHGVTYVRNAIKCCARAVGEPRGGVLRRGAQRTPSRPRAKLARCAARLELLSHEYSVMKICKEQIRSQPLDKSPMSHDLSHIDSLHGMYGVCKTIMQLGSSLTCVVRVNTRRYLCLKRDHGEAALRTFKSLYSSKWESMFVVCVK